MSSRLPKYSSPQEFRVDVIELGVRPRNNAICCVLGKNISFRTRALDSFASRNWDSRVHDALVLTAAVDFCDRIAHRNAKTWGRSFDVRVAVDSPERWNDAALMRPLVDSLRRLTGDEWRFVFIARSSPAETPEQGQFDFPTGIEATIPFSDGMDSLAVSCLEGQRLGDRIIRVRVSGGEQRRARRANGLEPFTALPYSVSLGRDNRENSARSRGFKFCVVAAVGAYLVDANTVILPESGQGIVGPVLAVVGQAYPDYRNHPVFTTLVSRFIHALFGHQVTFVFPRIWSTKGATLREFVDSGSACDTDAWLRTRSCWQQPRQVSVERRWRQCGICAACLLRRMSVHAAGLVEPTDTYVWENLAASTLAEGVSAGFGPERITRAFSEYAVAGVLHLKHLADFGRETNPHKVQRRHIAELATSLGQPAEQVDTRLGHLLRSHREEWDRFVGALGTNSFIAQYLG